MVLSQYPIGETQPWATAASLYRTTFLKCPKLPLIFDGVRQPPAPLQGKRYCHLSMSRSRMVRMPLRKLRERREREKGRQSRPAALYTAFISKFHQIGPSTSAVRGGRAGGRGELDGRTGGGGGGGGTVKMCGKQMFFATARALRRRHASRSPAPSHRARAACFQPAPVLLVRGRS